MFNDLFFLSIWVTLRGVTLTGIGGWLRNGTYYYYNPDVQHSASSSSSSSSSVHLVCLDPQPNTIYLTSLLINVFWSLCVFWVIHFLHVSHDHMISMWLSSCTVNYHNLINYSHDYLLFIYFPRLFVTVVSMIKWFFFITLLLIFEINKNVYCTWTLFPSFGCDYIF